MQQLHHVRQEIDGRCVIGNTPAGWARVQTICDFVHDHIKFNYLDAGATRGAARGFAERRGVCRDFAHLAVTFCRCMNIPARYCTGYLRIPVFEVSGRFENGRLGRPDGGYRPCAKWSVSIE